MNFYSEVADSSKKGAFIQRLTTKLANFSLKIGGSKLLNVVDSEISNSNNPLRIISGIARAYYDILEQDSNRINRYNLYDQLDDENILIGGALDAYADNTTYGMQDDNLSQGFEVKTSNSKISSVIESLNTITDMPSQVRGWARTLAKYGDLPIEVVVAGDMSIVKVVPINPKHFSKNVDSRGRIKQIPDNVRIRYAEGVDVNSAKKNTMWLIREDTEGQSHNPNSEIVGLLPWQLAHFRLKGEPWDIYGYKNSVVSRARRVSRQLQMIEDGMVIGRLSRSHMRYKWSIDTGNMNPKEAKQFVEEYKRDQTLQRIFDKQGKLKLETKNLAPEEDIYIPTNKESKAGVDILQGSGNLGNINDVLYFRQLLFAATKVPKAYFGMEEGVRSKSTITYLDVQFARFVRQIQLAMVHGYRQIYDTQLALRDIDPATAEYEIVPPVISTVDELMKLQIDQAKLKFAEMMRVPLQIPISSEWILTNLLNYDDEDIKNMGLDQDEIKKGPDTTIEQIRRFQSQYSTILDDVKMLSDWKLENKGFTPILGTREPITLEGLEGFPLTQE